MKIFRLPSFEHKTKLTKAGTNFFNLRNQFLFLLNFQSHQSAAHQVVVSCIFFFLNYKNNPKYFVPSLVSFSLLLCMTPYLFFLFAQWVKNPINVSILILIIFILDIFTLIENYSKLRIWFFFQFLHFPLIFVLLQLTCLVTLFDRKLQIFKNLPKWTIFWHF